MEEKYQETLTILDGENLDKKKLNIVRRKTKKSQILLCDTHRRIDDFFSKVKYRKNGRYSDIPHFVINKQGHIYQLFDTNYYSTTFGDNDLDKKQIKIALENLGWLNKNTINGFLFNWIGDPYRTDPYIRGWRNRFYWDKYTDEQIKSLKGLCEFLIEKHNISNNFISTNGYFTKASNFKGILCKSNFSDIYTDINPSFNFNFLHQNEQKIHI